MKHRLFMKDKRDNNKNHLIRKIRRNLKLVSSNHKPLIKKEVGRIQMIVELDLHFKWMNSMTQMTLISKWTKTMKKRNLKNFRCISKCSNKWSSLNKPLIRNSNNSNNKREFTKMMMKMRWKVMKDIIMRLMRTTSKCMKSS